MDQYEDLTPEGFASMAKQLMREEPPPSALERLPCAYAIPSRQWSCQKPGTNFCSACRLECQKNHWRTHKGDCKDEVRSKTWSPGWVVENRQPTFMSRRDTTPTATAYFKALAEEEPLSMGLHLWGNIPAMDLLNLSLNEGVEYARNAKLDIALVASGDFRDVILTVNSLPEDFQGTLNVLLNDREPTLVARNVALLLLFSGNHQIGSGSAVDPALATEIVLHLWASVCVPAASDFRLAVTIANFITEVIESSSLTQRPQNEEIPFNVPLGAKSRLKGVLTTAVFAKLYAWGERNAHDIYTVSHEMERVRFAPTRKDRHDRHYCRLNPSHRVSFMEFRRFGLTLPFGARNDLFNTPNRLLFTPDGRWLQNDLANPLESWNIESVIEAGKAHGASSEDLYGCLYFFLSDTFREFITRLRRFSIDFEVFCTDASELSGRLKETSASTSTSATFNSPRRFDRIHVSNIVDTNYRGVARVLEDWGSFLKPKKESCILGYFMNWPMGQKGADSQSIPSSALSQLMKQHVNEGKIPRVDASASFEDVKRTAGLLLGYGCALTARIENSKAFKEYLKRQRLEEALKKTGMQWRIPHTVLPYRIGVPPEKSNTIESLPNFHQDKERWYLNACVDSSMWTERFIEFCRNEF